MRTEMLLLALFALAIPLGGCRPAATPDASTPATPEATTTATPGETPAEAPAATPVDSGAVPPAAGAAPAPVAASPAPAAIASAEGEKAGLRIEVHELKRGSGDTVTLKFALVNDSDEDFSIHSSYLGESGIHHDYASVGAIHLVDAAGKKKYMVVRDTEKICLCSMNVKEIKARSRANLWAKYPAPPAGTTAVNIVVPHFSPMDDVPIAQ